MSTRRFPKPPPLSEEAVWEYLVSELENWREDRSILLEHEEEIADNAFLADRLFDSKREAFDTALDLTHRRSNPRERSTEYQWRFAVVLDSGEDDPFVFHLAPSEVVRVGEPSPDVGEPSPDIRVGPDVPVSRLALQLPDAPQEGWYSVYIDEAGNEGRVDHLLVDGFLCWFDRDEPLPEGLGPPVEILGIFHDDFSPRAEVS